MSSVRELSWDRAEGRGSMKQLNTGYYHDWSTLKHGSKLWTGPPTLVREEVSFFCRWQLDAEASISMLVTCRTSAGCGCRTNRPCIRLT